MTFFCYFLRFKELGGFLRGKKCIYIHIHIAYFKIFNDKQNLHILIFIKPKELKYVST